MNSAVASDIIETPSKDNTFTIAHISDTQENVHHVESFDAITSWLVNNKIDLNLQAVAHTGDIVDYWNVTTYLDRANHSLSILKDGGVPYVWTVGNHDIDLYGARNTVFNTYVTMNSAIFASEPYWVGSFNEGKNNAVRFSQGQYDFMLIGLDYYPTNQEVNWFKRLAESNPHTNIIFFTHAFMKYDLTYDIPSIAPLLNEYPNVFLTFNGHQALPWNPTKPSWTANHTTVNNRVQSMMNNQNMNLGGNAAMLFTFDTSTYPAQVSVKTFLATNNSYLSGNNFNWNFSVSLKAKGDPSPTYSPSVTPLTTQIITLKPKPTSTLAEIPQPTETPPLYGIKNFFAIESNSTVSAINFQSTKSVLDFTVSGPTGSTGYVNITVNKNVLPFTDTLKIYLNSTIQTPIFIDNGAETYSIILNYDHSSLGVKVVFQEANISSKIDSDLGYSFMGVSIGLIIFAFFIAIFIRIIFR